MANFNLADYETVEARIAKFYAAHEDGRIVTENVTTAADRERGIWVVKSSVFISLAEQVAGAPKATGYAFEIDGGPGANRTAALENCETSSIGRALANMGLHGSKRASREEMSKAARGPVKPSKAVDSVVIDWAHEIAQVKTVEAARGLYGLAVAEKASADVLDAITAAAEALKA